MLLRESVFALCVALGLGVTAWAAETPEQIQALLDANAPYSQLQRIESWSQHFEGRPYLAGPLGEGERGKYDQDPLYRFDGFDCTTFVETVSSLALSTKFQEFESYQDRIRYKDAEISFTTRNHFTDLDWVPNIVAAGLMRDITDEVSQGNFAMAEAIIDKPAWYKKLGIDTIQIPGLEIAAKQVLLRELHDEGKAFQPEVGKLPYITLKALFGPAGGPIWDRIPSGAILNIIRPNWNLVEQTGTHQNVSHQGWVIRLKGVPYLRHASDPRGVVTVSLREYLERYIDHATIKGINLLELR